MRSVPEQQMPDGDDLPDVDPQEFLRAMLRISPEDAEKVREEAAKKASDHKTGRHRAGNGRREPRGDSGRG